MAKIWIPRFVLVVFVSLDCVFGVGCRKPVEMDVATPTNLSLRLSFSDATTEAGLSRFRHTNGAEGAAWFPETMGSGGGFIDYDGDGWLDIVLVGGGTWAKESDEQITKLWLYRNAGDGTFLEDNEGSGLGGLEGYGLGVNVADYDNDGDQDLYYTTLGPNHLMRNDGGHFVDVSSAAKLGDDTVWSTSSLFFDADRDGWLDLFVGNYVDWSPADDLFCSTDGSQKDYCTPELYEGSPGNFYHNNGDGTFTERTREAGFSTTVGKSLGVTDLDFNADGWPDLAVANDTEPDLLYQNNGDGTFSEIGLVSGFAFDERGRARAGMGIDAGITDGTGQTSIFVGNFSSQTIGVYRHTGNGVFVDRAASSKMGRASLLTLTFGLFLFDVDLDGDLDLFAANGHVQPSIESVTDNVKYRQPSHLFENLGDGTFTDRAPEVGTPLTKPIVGRGAAFGDYDNDGDQDILVTENGGPVHLWENKATGRFLRVNLIGTTSNRDGIDANVTAVLNGTRIGRRVRTGSSFLSNSEKTITLGLSDAEIVDSLIVEWPSGIVDRHGAIMAGQTVNLTEGSRDIKLNTRSQ